MPATSEAQSGRPGRDLGVGVALLALLAAVASARLAPPDAKDPGADPGEFSAGRAMALLRELLGEGAPHPVGTEANARVRERLVTALTRLGYSPEIQDAFACGRFGICARVRNVIARLEGRDPKKAVLLLAHYDSVAAGPGAADDGSGSAILLEVARALRRAPRPLHDVILLADEGEEGGLIGATAFHSEHRWARDVGAIVNLEARGTCGPSLLFETSGESGWIVRRLGAMAHPVASSLFATVYEWMPHDTDLTVFSEDGIPGLNFAFIGAGPRQHTPLDDVAHLSPGSLQHQGDNALAMVTTLAEADLERQPPGREVFFDVLGLFVVRWPERASFALAVLALALLAAAAVAMRRAGGATARDVAWGVASLLVAAVLAAVLAGALRLGGSLAGALPRQFVAHAAPALAVFGSAGLLAAAVATAGALWGRAQPAGLWLGLWIGWGLAGAAAALALPGASYLFIVPALVAGAAGLLWASPLAHGRGGRAAAAVAPAIAAGIVLFPVALLVDDALGTSGAPLAAAIVAIVAVALAPLAPRSGIVSLVGVPLAGIAAGAIAGWIVPNATVSLREPMLIAFHEDGDAGTSRWLVHAEDDRLPAAMRAAADFSAARSPPFPWAAMRPSFAAPALPRRLAAPEWTVLDRREEGGRRIVRGHLRSRRGAADVSLVFPPSAPVESVALAGVRVRSPDHRLRSWYGDWQPFRCLTTPPEGIEVEVVLSGHEPISAEILDESPGLPPGGGTLAAARPPTATPIQEGDVTLVTRRISL